MQKIVLVFLFSVLLCPVWGAMDEPQKIKTARDTISDQEIVLPESLEANVDSLLSSWFLKKYAIIDENCIRGSVNIDYPDSVYVQRLAALPTVIEMPFNQVVKSYITLYTEKRRALVETMIGLSAYYFPFFEQALEREGLPLELKYLPIIESALRPDAVSRAGATGLWQFMIGTAKPLGLEVNSLVDERRDPVRSSETAVRYLKELYNIYQDWPLAIASYNCGPGNVNKAIRRSGGKKDYWEIYNYLPRETRGYLPAFIAANYIMRYYPEHNICPVLTDLPLTTDTIQVSSRIHLQQIADVLQIPMDLLRGLNPQYRKDIIPGDIRLRTLRLPAQQAYAFIDAQDSIANYQSDIYSRRMTVEPANYYASAGGQAGNWVYHRVKKGESLSVIANRYGVSVRNLRSWNHLKNNNIVAGRKLKVYRAELARKTVTKKIEKTDSVTVVSKDSTFIAQSAKDIKSESSVISPVSNRKNISTARNPRNPAYDRYRYHKVTRGESLWTISQRFPGVTTDLLKKVNNLNSSSLKVGQILKIPEV
ncbi:LysM peptidoglycan-binding domain-containing protein [Coprobacter sp.]